MKLILRHAASKIYLRPVWFEIVSGNKLRIIDQTKSCVEEHHGDMLSSWFYLTSSLVTRMKE